MAATSGRTGRPRASGVWQHFHYDPQLNRSECQVVSNDKKCGIQLKGKFPSNLRNHLKSYHKGTYQVLEEKEKEKSTTIAKDGRNPQIPKLFSGTVKELEKENTKHKKITEKLATFVATSGISHSIVENDEFKRLLKELHPTYPLPCSTQLARETDKLLATIKHNVSTKIRLANRVHLSVHHRTEKELGKSFVTVTGHFVAEQAVHHVTLTARHTPSPPPSGNTAFSIVLGTLQDWNIDPGKIGKVLTDNGSDMTKDFEDVQRIVQHPDKEQNDEPSHNLELESHQTASSLLCDNNCSTDRTFDRGSAIGIILNDDRGNTTEANKSDYELKETDHATAFSRSFHRLSCFTHTLQLVASTFESSETLQSVIQKAKQIVAKLYFSEGANERLTALAGNSLVQDRPARWYCTFLFVDQLLKVRTDVSQVLEELDWNNLQMEEWERLEDVRLLLEPFAQYTNLRGGENCATISSAIPIVMELTLHLQEMRKKPGLSAVSNSLLLELHSHFDNLSDLDHTNFTPLYLMATALDHRFSLILTDKQREVAKQHIIDALLLKEPEHSMSATVSENEPERRDDAKPPPLKRFKRLSDLVSTLTPQPSLRQPTNKAEREAVEFFSRVQTSDFKDKDLEPLEFWQSSKSLYPALSELASDVLTIPASLDSVKQECSAAGNLCSGKRNRTTNSKLERSLFIEHNKKYIRI